MKIDINKKYRTRGGDKVVLYTVDGLSDQPVIGEVVCKDGAVANQWRYDGRFFEDGREATLDLVEVTNKIHCDDDGDDYIIVLPYDDGASVATYGSEGDASVILSPEKTQQLIELLKESLE